MAKEIERKFLLAKGASIPIPSDFQKVKIKQAYLSAEKTKHVRLRITNYGQEIISEIGIKFTGKLVRDEFEYEIPNSEAIEIYKKCDWVLEKKRLSFASHTKTSDPFSIGVDPNIHYDIDSFPNGMQWIEVEFKTIKDMKKWEKNKPHWIGKEITGVSKYSNITLAKKKLKF